MHPDRETDPVILARAAAALAEHSAEMLAELGINVRERDANVRVLLKRARRAVPA